MWPFDEGTHDVVVSSLIEKGVCLGAALFVKNVSTFLFGGFLIFLMKYLVALKSHFLYKILR
jgi:hypothetical protein